MEYLENLFSLKNRVAVTVGSGGVLGGALAEALAGAGAGVAVLDLDEAAADARASEIRDRCGSDCIGIRADATKRSDLEDALEVIKDRWDRVDILLNAPGVNSATPFFEITAAEWDRILDVNLKTTLLACQVFGREMIEQGEGGSVINTASVSAGPPLSKVFAYSVSKAGIVNLTQSLAREWAPHRVRVNAIAPGFFPTPQNQRILTEERIESIFGHTPMARFGEPRELAGAAVWLASDSASFTTGAVIAVDGGFTAMTI